jgi:hypothetical protein
MATSGGIMNDPIHILVEAFAKSLISHGHAVMPAYLEAEGLALDVLEQMHKAGAGLGHLLVRVKVYELRSRGVDPHTVMMRLGISRTQVWKAYKKELLRRRYVA